MVAANWPLRFVRAAQRNCCQVLAEELMEDDNLRSLAALQVLDGFQLRRAEQPHTK